MVKEYELLYYLGREFWHVAGFPVYKLIRFLDKIQFTESCWLWTASKTQAGYGTISYMEESVPAHRFAYLAFRGPIPEGKHLHHVCEVRACVNPEHLTPLEPRVHAKEHTPLSITSLQSRQTHCHKGHELSGWNLILRNGHRRCRQCINDWVNAKNRAKAAANPAPVEIPTHCANGHEFNEENTYFYRGRRQCRQCHNVNSARFYKKKREGQPDRSNASKTHCKRGHEYTPENTRIDQKGRRTCKQCYREVYSKRQSQKTHCKNGHPWIPENIKHYKQRGRVQATCRICHDEQGARAYEKFKQSSPSV